MKNYVVTAAIIMNNEQILCMQRGKGKYDYLSFKFEFPGGKVESGESNVEGLMRELVEEMDLRVNITPADFFLTVQHTYPDFSITLHSYICRVPNREFVMKEHNSHRWLTAEKLITVDWAAADLPIVEKLMKANEK